MDFKNPDYVVVRVARRRKRVAVRFQQMRAKFFREIRSKRFRIVPLANVAFVYRLAWMQIRGQHVFPKILQIVARVWAMATLVRLGSRMEAHVSLQMRSDLSSESASRVWTRAKIRFGGGLRSVVASAVASKLGPRFGRVTAIRAFVTPGGRRSVVNQAHVRSQLGRCAKHGRASRKPALVLLPSVS